MSDGCVVKRTYNARACKSGDVGCYAEEVGADTFRLAGKLVVEVEREALEEPACWDLESGVCTFLNAFCDSGDGVGAL